MIVMIFRQFFWKYLTNIETNFMYIDNLVSYNRIMFNIAYNLKVLITGFKHFNYIIIEKK